MTLKSETKRLEKLADKTIIKKGMGIGTTIANKHAYEFDKRFYSENAQVIKEAKEEWDRIRAKRVEKYLARKSAYMSRNIPKQDKEEYHRRMDFIKSIKYGNKQRTNTK